MRCRMNSTSGTAPIACGGVRGRVGARVGVVVQGGAGRAGQRASRLACSSASTHAALHLLLACHTPTRTPGPLHLLLLACSSASPHAAAPAASANSVTSAPLAAVALTCSRWKPACGHATGQGYHAGLEARAGGQGWRPGLEAAGGHYASPGWVGLVGLGRGRGRHIAELTHEARVATQEVVDVRRAEVARQPHASGRVDLAEPRQPFVGREAR